MFKKVPFILIVLLSIGYTISSEVNLVVPEESLSLVSSGKGSQSVLDDRASISRSESRNTLEENSNGAEDDEEDEDGNIAPAVPISSSSRRVSSISSSISSSGLSSSSSSYGTIRSPSLVLSTSASSSNKPTIHHRVLPAETIPLPIRISTRPGLRTVIAPETITIQQPTVARIGEVIQNIPTAVSHQRQTIVHNHARVVTPIVAPAVRTITSQVLRAYHTPLIVSPHSTVVRLNGNKN